MNLLLDTMCLFWSSHAVNIPFWFTLFGWIIIPINTENGQVYGLYSR